MGRWRRGRACGGMMGRASGGDSVVRWWAYSYYYHAALDEWVREGGQPVDWRWERR